MIRTNYKASVHAFFYAYTKWKIRHNFSKIHFPDNYSIPKDKSILMISNHFSWWDGFWLFVLNEKLLKKRFHFMMLENELKKRWLFRFSGGFSVAPGTKSNIESVQYSRELLSNKNNLVLIFPQGKFHSMYQDEFHFMRGVEKILQNKKNPTQLVFAVSLIEYFENQKPELYLYLKNFEVENYTTAFIERAYEQFYRENLFIHKKSER